MKISNDELSVKAYHKVKNMIVSGKLQLGQKIVQDKLAEKLGISRTPLRSALQMLEAESLVESLPRKGMAVKIFSNKEVLEIYDCRIALESMAVKTFVKVSVKSDIEKLYNLFKPFLGSKDIDVMKYKKADSLFHEMIIKKSGNEFLYKLFNRGNLLICIDLIGLVRSPQETLSEHMDIIEAIEEKNSKLAEDLIKEHLEKSKKLISRRF
ncbi:GntR family transcriptional regulator [Aestuariivivens sediminis]|uniref:GntR family transcriptional regulator n=1 Tax=Aestuariivivens sediminis TaxID=2913557 RepID=UPI001F5A4F8E|nr:GntR family transcriptional regulator [Aestuariivivens sediminis]